MTKNLHLLMPMGGKGSRFFEQGFDLPKPLIPLCGKPFFYWATQSLLRFLPLSNLTFVVLQEHIDKFSIDKEILTFFPSANIVSIPNVLNGPVLTSMEGIKHIEDGQNILINDCDHLFICHSFYDFIKSDRQLDGGLLTFASNDPKYSYAKCNADGTLLETVEKKVISNQAICGAYYFKNKQTFYAASKEYMQNCTYSEYYISGMYNTMAKQGMSTKCFTVDLHLPFGTPEEYEIAQKSDAFLQLN